MLADQAIEDKKEMYRKRKAAKDIISVQRLDAKATAYIGGDENLITVNVRGKFQSLGEHKRFIAQAVINYICYHEKEILATASKFCLANRVGEENGKG